MFSSYMGISPLDKEDVDKLSDLMEALIRINKNDRSETTSEILTKVDEYLNQWLENLNRKDYPQFLQKEQSDWLTWVRQRFEIYTKINQLNPDQQKDLVDLGYFLQGQLSTEKEFEDIRKILRSYLARIEQFRSSPPSQ